MLPEGTPVELPEDRLAAATTCGRCGCRWRCAATGWTRSTGCWTGCPSRSTPATGRSPGSGRCCTSSRCRPRTSRSCSPTRSRVGPRRATTRTSDGPGRTAVRAGCRERPTEVTDARPDRPARDIRTTRPPEAHVSLAAEPRSGTPPPARASSGWRSTSPRPVERTWAAATDWDRQRRVDARHQGPGHGRRRPRGRRRDRGRHRRRPARAWSTRWRSPAGTRRTARTSGTSAGSCAAPRRSRCGPRPGGSTFVWTEDLDLPLGAAGRVGFRLAAPADRAAGCGLAAPVAAGRPGDVGRPGRRLPRARSSDRRRRSGQLVCAG